MSLTTFVIAACVFVFTLFVYLHHSSTPNQRTKRTARPPVQKFTFFSVNSREKMTLEDAIVAVKQPISQSVMQSFQLIQATGESLKNGNAQHANSESFELSIIAHRSKQHAGRGDANDLKETPMEKSEQQVADSKKLQQTETVPSVKTVTEELLTNPKKLISYHNDR
jgi:hypothetical protein